MVKEERNRQGGEPNFFPRDQLAGSPLEDEVPWGSIQHT